MSEKKKLIKKMRQLLFAKQEKVHGKRRHLTQLRYDFEQKKDSEESLRRQLLNLQVKVRKRSSPPQRGIGKGKSHNTSPWQIQLKKHAPDSKLRKKSTSHIKSASYVPTLQEPERKADLMINYGPQLECMDSVDGIWF